MKGLVFLLCVALASAQTTTVTEELAAAQAELTIGHEFAELYLVQSRRTLSDHLEVMELEILDSFLTAYASIKDTATETRAEMAGIPDSACTIGVKARYELQVSRFGQRLSQCLRVADGYIKDFTSILNEAHDDSRVYKNMIPNVGVNVLATLDIFDGRDNLQTYINNGLRDLFFVARDFQEGFGEYIEEISSLRDEYVRQLTSCFRTYPNTFVAYSDQDLASIRECEF